jgi:hypothetical protein
MRKATLVLGLVLLSLSAGAGTITSISPDSIDVNSGEYFITIFGTDLGDVVSYSGPAGDFLVDISASDGGSVTVWVPSEVIAAAGDYDVTVLGGPTGDSGPAVLHIVNTGGTPLTIVVPESAGAEAQGPGAVTPVTYEVFAYGGQDPNPTVSCNPASGSLFAPGVTTVECTASNSFGETAEDSFDVFVYDVTRPVLSLPADFTVDADSSSGATVTYSATADDDIDGPVPVNCSPASGSLFAMGTTTVTCTTIDSSSNDTGGSFDVTVADLSAPQITSVTATPNVLTPANKKMKAVTIGVTVTDNVDATPTCSVFDVTSTQPIAGDWTITGPLSVSLRASRTNNVTRVYTVHVSCTDDASNTSASSVNVTVP